MPSPPKRRDNGLGPDFHPGSGRFLVVAMRSMGTFHLDGGFLAPASKPAGKLLALLVATLIGVASGTAVILCLENGGTTETQLTAMPATKEPAYAGVQREAPSPAPPALNQASALPVTDSAQADLILRQSPTGGAAPAVSTNVGRQEQAQSEHDPQKQPRLMVHRRRYYAPRLANRLLVSPILRPW